MKLLIMKFSPLPSYLVPLRFTSYIIQNKTYHSTHILHEIKKESEQPFVTFSNITTFLVPVSQITLLIFQV
jgi:hypothetical protein